MKRKKVAGIECEIGSGNVLADLGLANPEETLAKAQLGWEIIKIIKKRKLTQKRGAGILKIAQPKVSLLLRGYVKSRFLNDLGQDIYIKIRPSYHHGHGSTMIGDSPSNARITALGKENS